MKRIKIILPTVLLLLVVVVCVVLSRPPRSASDLPRFIPLTTQPTGPFGKEFYDSSDAIPFRDGKGWVFTHMSRSNHHLFLYDLNKGIVLGELTNAGAVVENQDRTKLLCEGPGSPYASFKDRAVILVNRLSFGKINLATNANQIETFWILDIRNNSAVRIGDLSQLPGTSSRWTPAPGFRYGYNEPTTLQGDQEFFLCDLEAATLKKVHLSIHLHGPLLGWWDDHSIFAEDSAENFVLYDVVTGQIRTAFTGKSIEQFLKENNLTNSPSGIKTTLSSNNGGFEFHLKDPVDVTAIHNWNGSNYDFYFCADRKRGLDTNTTFLIKVDRPSGKLKLLYREFQFKWSGHLDATATHYLYDGYNGLPGRGGNGGVVLLDLNNNTEREIVPADNSGQYALSRLCGGDTVIFWRNRVLWRIDLNSTNATRLFPPPGNGK
jgi:hypothetical protein